MHVDSVVDGAESVADCYADDAAMKAEPERRRKPRAASEPTLAERQQHALEQILDRFARGVVVVGSRLEILYRNAAARTLMGRRELFTSRAGRLLFYDRQLSKDVQAYVAGGDGERHTKMLLPVAKQRSAAGSSAFRVVITPLRPAEKRQAASAWLLFVSELASERHIEPEVLRRHYRLTGAEARIVANLYAGRSLPVTARKLDISINTAKTLLRRAFQKCAVRSQAELVQLIALGPRGL
jgi:DNA-binding CsgD family transcriptional regulator